MLSVFSQSLIMGTSFDSNLQQTDPHNIGKSTLLHVTIQPVVLHVAYIAVGKEIHLVMLGYTAVGLEINYMFISFCSFIYSDLLNYGDEKLCTYTCMVYHNCLRGMLDRKSEMGAQHCGQILCDVVKATIDKESEYG